MVTGEESMWAGYRDRRQLSHLFSSSLTPRDYLLIGRALAPPRRGRSWTPQAALAEIEQGSNAARALQQLMIAAVGGLDRARQIAQDNDFTADGRFNPQSMRRLLAHMHTTSAIQDLQERLSDRGLYRGDDDGVAGEQTIRALAQAMRSPAEIQRVFGVTPVAETASVVEPSGPRLVGDVLPAVRPRTLALIQRRVPVTEIREEVVAPTEVSLGDGDPPQPRRLDLAVLAPTSGVRLPRLLPRTTTHAPLRTGPGGQLLGPPVISASLHLRFGQSTVHGTPSRGLGLQLRPGATINSPVNGQVVYAGEFRTYGQMIIISTGEGTDRRHVVLSGLSSLDVQPGQHVLQGEPLGAMAAISPSPRDGGPVLTLEVRDVPGPGGSPGRYLDPASLFNDDFRRLLGITPVVADLRPTG